MKRPYQLREWIIEHVFGPMTTGHWEVHSYASPERRDWVADRMNQPVKNSDGVWLYQPQVELRDSPDQPWRPYREEG